MVSDISESWLEGGKGKERRQRKGAEGTGFFTAKAQGRGETLRFFVGEWFPIGPL